MKFFNKHNLTSLVILSVYPMFIGSRLLGTSAGAHFSAVENDVALYMRHAQALSRMHLPWSKSNFETFPDWTYPWRIESIPSTLTELYVWATGKVFGPTFAVNSYALAGIFLVGLLAYIICRLMSVRIGLSILSGVTAQCLPGMRQMLITGMAATWSPIFPLALIALLIWGYTQNWRRLKTFSFGLLLIGISFFQSTVSFYFASVVFFVWMVIERRRFYKEYSDLQRKLRYSLTTTAVLVITGIGIGLYRLLQQTTSELGKPYSVYSKAEVLKDSYSFSGFLRPDPFHLIFSGGSWELEGYSQQYGGAIVVVLGAIGLLFIRNRTREASFLGLIAAIFLAMSLGPISVGNFTIPSTREFLRFLMPGNRRFAIAGLVFQILLVVGFAQFLNQFALANRNQRFRSVLTSVIVLASLFDLNPNSRLYVNNYSRTFVEFRSVLKEGREDGLYIAPQTIRTKNYYVVNHPIYKNQIDPLAYAALGSEQLHDFLAAQDVSFVISNVNSQNEAELKAYIQNSLRLQLKLPGTLFQPAASDVALLTTDDQGQIEDAQHVRLLRLSGFSNRSLPHKYRLAQFVSEPILEVPYGSMERSKIEIEWATSSEVQFTFEPLYDDAYSQRRSRVLFKFDLRAPAGVGSPLVVKISSLRGDETLTLGKEPTTVIASSQMFDSINISTLNGCNTSSDPSLGELSGRTVCFGISNFAVVELLN